MLKDVEMTVKRSKRKTLSIYIERDGAVSVLAPESLSDEELEKVIRKKEYLIYKYLAQWEQLNESRVEREFVNGQSYLYLGRNYRLELVEEQDEPLKLKNGYFLLRKKDSTKAKQIFIDFYKEKGLPRIIGRVKYYQERMGLAPKEIKMMELKNRWASCSPQGNLNFHWKCIMAPLDVLDYIVVHELAHLIHKNHTPAFWNEVDKVLPNYERQKEWLRQFGASMDL